MGQRRPSCSDAGSSALLAARRDRRNGVLEQRRRMGPGRTVGHHRRGGSDSSSSIATPERCSRAHVLTAATYWMCPYCRGVAGRHRARHAVPIDTHLARWASNGGFTLLVVPPDPAHLQLKSLPSARAAGAVTPRSTMTSSRRSTRCLQVACIATTLRHRSPTRHDRPDLGSTACAPRPSDRAESGR